MLQFPGDLIASSRWEGCPDRLPHPWDEEIRLVQRQKLTDSVGACSGDDDIRQGKEMPELFLDILELCVTFQVLQGFIAISRRPYRFFQMGRLS